MKQYILIRKVLKTDVKEFADLMELSAPQFLPLLYGGRLRSIIQSLFVHKYNLFSFQHVYFAEIENRRVGISLEYSWYSKIKENLRTGILILKYMRQEFIKKISIFLNTMGATGYVSKSEYYISNIAIYPEYRGIQIGTKLLANAEKEAKQTNAKRVVLDVKIENLGAIKLYKRLGYTICKKSIVNINENIFSFYRMQKEL